MKKVALQFSKFPIYKPPGLSCFTLNVHSALEVVPSLMFFRDLHEICHDKVFNLCCDIFFCAPAIFMSRHWRIMSQHKNFLSIASKIQLCRDTEKQVASLTEHSK